MQCNNQKITLPAHQHHMALLPWHESQAAVNISAGLKCSMILYELIIPALPLHHSAIIIRWWAVCAHS